MILSRHLRVELQQGVLWRDEQPVRLTPNEQAVLGVLLEAQGRVVGRSELNSLALGYHAQSSSRALDATIQRLRKKMEADPSEPVHLLSVYGKGYRLARSEVPAGAPRPAIRPGWLATRFMGRIDELKALHKAVVDTRAVALCGVSGVGKSRLAAEYLRENGHRHPGGAVWADLSSAETLADALRVIGTALGLAVRKGANETIAEEIGRALDASGGLLLLDGAEHVVDELAPMALRWLGAPGVHLIITSSMHVRLQGWSVYTLEGLDEAHSKALLRDRVDLSLAYSDKDAAVLVAQLDGLPLAIEFAAHRMRVVGMKGMLRALERGARTSQDSPVLVGAVTWAIGTLSPEAREALGRAAVFAHPFDLDAFASVCLGQDEVGAATVIEELLDRSLLRRDTRAEEPVFSLYGAVRRVVGSPAAEVRHQHARWFESVGVEAPEVWAIDAPYMRRVRRSLGDYVAAWRWSREVGDTARMARLALGISPYLHHAGPFALHTEILDASVEQASDARTAGRLHLARAAAHMSNVEEARARECLVHAARCLGRGESRWHGRLEHMIGKVEWRRKPAMEVWFHRSVQSMEQAGDLAGAALVQADLAQRLLSRMLGQGATAPRISMTPELARADALAKRTGSPQAAMMVDWARSYVHRAQGRTEVARTTLESVRDRFVALGSAANAWSVEMSLAYLAWWSTGDFAGLARHIRAARRMAAGFLALRLDLIEAATHYEEVLDEGARQAMLRALELAVGREDLAGDALSIRIRLVLLESVPGDPAPSVRELQRLGVEAAERQDFASMSESNMAARTTCTNRSRTAADGQLASTGRR